MKYHRTRYLILITAIIVIAVLFWTDPEIQEKFYDFVDYLKGFISENQYLGIFIFILFSALSAILSPFSSIPFVPPAILIWGEAATVILLTIGWFIGGIIAYTIGSYFGAPVVNYLIYKEKIHYYHEKITSKAEFWLVFLFRLALPSEITSYVLGIAQYQLKGYIVATLSTEAIFAALTVYASEALINKNPTLLIALVASSLLIISAIGYMLHRIFSKKK